MNPFKLFTVNIAVARLYSPTLQPIRHYSHLPYNLLPLYTLQPLIYFQIADFQETIDRTQTQLPCLHETAQNECCDTGTWFPKEILIVILPIEIITFPVQLQNLDNNICYGRWLQLFCVRGKILSYVAKKLLWKHLIFRKGYLIICDLDVLWYVNDSLRKV